MPSPIRVNSHGKLITFRNSFRISSGLIVLDELLAGLRWIFDIVEAELYPLMLKSMSHAQVEGTVNYQRAIT